MLPSEPGWLEEGEEILWSGRPSLPIVIARACMIVLVEIGVIYLAFRFLAGDGALERLSSELQRVASGQPIAALAAGLALAALPVLLVRRWIGERYAVTDRRLVAFRSGGKLSWSLPPDLVIRVRRGWLAAALDVRFNQTLPRRVGSDGKSRKTAFRSLLGPAAVADRVQRWLQVREDEVRRTARERIAVSSSDGHFSIEAPRTWELRQYHVGDPAQAALLKPLEDEPSAPGALDDDGPWNALVLFGPWRTSLSVESYAGAPPDVAGGDAPPAWLLGLLGAGLEEREQDARLGGVVGERVRWRISGSRVSGPRRHLASYVFDQWTLQDGARWYRIIAVWSEALPGAETALREVVDTFEVLEGTPASAAPEGPAPGAHTG